MPLDPQARDWLEAAVAAGARPYQELGLEEARRLVSANAVELFGAVAEVERVDDVSAGGVPARAYRPAGGVDSALVWLHGGGWVIGSLESHDPLCRALAARTGCTVLSVDYRLAPEHPHPAALEDAWTATTWAVAEFGRAAVGGDSAGGHLATVVARRARDDGIDLRLQVLVVPVADCSFETASYAANRSGYGLERETMEWFWDLYLQGGATPDDPDVSPLRAHDLSGLAPALVLTAEFDPLRDEGEAYAARLRRAGVPVEHKRYEGMIHGFFRMPAVLDRSRDALDQVVQAVARSLVD
jgi:acetyl esterase/lipase